MSRITPGSVPEDECIAEAGGADCDVIVSVLPRCVVRQAGDGSVAFIVSNEVNESGGGFMVPVAVVAIATLASGVSVAELILQGGMPGELCWVRVWALVSQQVWARASRFPRGACSDPCTV